MSSQLVRHSNYAVTTLDKGLEYEVREVAQQSAMVSEMAQVTNYEMARLGAHAIRTMAELVRDMTHVQQQLSKEGCRHPIYPDAQDKLLQVTGQNMITLVNTTQQDMVRKSVSHMG